jgi:hypothetical protein
MLRHELRVQQLNHWHAVRIIEFPKASLQFVAPVAAESIVGFSWKWVPAFAGTTRYGQDCYACSVGMTSCQS